MRRVMARYKGGQAFTNEPGVSSNVVGRDAAWFVYGNDHFLPDFSRALLEKLAAVQDPNGKIPEYYDAIDDRAEDDGLNINDDTPCSSLPSTTMPERRATFHGCVRLSNVARLRGTSYRKWTIAVWSSAVRLIRAGTCGQSPAGETLSLAILSTVPLRKINAECVAGCRAASHLAQNIGEESSDADDFASASREIATAMDEHLLNPQNGLYYLNVDVDGCVHTDVTGDTDLSRDVSRLRRGHRISCHQPPERSRFLDAGRPADHLARRPALRPEW